MRVSGGHRRRSIRASAISIAALMLITGCTSTDDSSTQSPPSSAPSSTQATEPASGAGTEVPGEGVPAAEELVVSVTGVGPVLTGMTIEEAVATGLFETDIEVDGGTACERIEDIVWVEQLASHLDVYATADGIISSIGVRGSGPRTASGIGLGSTFGEALAAYPALVVEESGYGQTGGFLESDDAWLGFLFDADVDSLDETHQITLMELTDGAKPSLMRDAC